MSSVLGTNLEGKERVRPCLKAVVNTAGVFLASRRVFCWLRLFFLFLFDKFILKNVLKHANEKKLARIAAVYQ